MWWFFFWQRGYKKMMGRSEDAHTTHANYSFDKLLPSWLLFANSDKLYIMSQRQCDSHVNMIISNIYS